MHADKRAGNVRGRDKERDKIKKKKKLNLD